MDGGDDPEQKIVEGELAEPVSAPAHDGESAGACDDPDGDEFSPAALFRKLSEAGCKLEEHGDGYSQEDPPSVYDSEAVAPPPP